MASKTNPVKAAVNRAVKAAESKAESKGGGPGAKVLQHPGAKQQEVVGTGAGAREVDPAALKSVQQKPKQKAEKPPALEYDDGIFVSELAEADEFADLIMELADLEDTWKPLDDRREKIKDRIKELMQRNGRVNLNCLGYNAYIQTQQREKMDVQLMLKAGLTTADINGFKVPFDQHSLYVRPIKDGGNGGEE